ncbi:hypothetical protein QJS10_CPA07g00619 [Acorus calamus]|uniref:Fatty acid desaturase domain-containing protein n=1 Tax=Acorus calamus TaxID=4465 RepID=A0AAV9EEM5_ACOCL|nr:hypothetical protein QJS10_CPA07g00619 [Acorus calamus]
MFIATIHNNNHHHPIRFDCSACSSSPKTVPDAVAGETKTPPWWSGVDVVATGVLGVMHALCLLAPFTFTSGALGVACALYVVTGLLGITLSYHRNLSHHSFHLPKWLEYTFAYCGAQAIQGDPIDWVRMHRTHHKYCDSARDPHSPINSFWFSHMDSMYDRVSAYYAVWRAEQCE